MAIFTDLDLRLKQHPITKDIVKLEDDFAIKMAIKNIVLTNKKEKRFNSNFGGNVRNYLFENLDIISTTDICSDITNLIYKYESRISDLKVSIISNDTNTINLQINYRCLNVKQNETLELLIRKIR